MLHSDTDIRCNKREKVFRGHIDKHSDKDVKGKCFAVIQTYTATREKMCFAVIQTNIATKMEKGNVSR